MVDVEVLVWRVRLDAEKTREAYKTTSTGGAAECTCASCLNYTRQQQDAFPPEVLQALTQLQIPRDKDLEVVEYGPSGEGRRLYGAWFYVVGELVASPTRALSSDGFMKVRQDVSVRISDQLVFVPAQWKGLKLLMVEVNFSLPWVLSEPPE
jgi:hypothetical protein